MNRFLRVLGPGLVSMLAAPAFAASVTVDMSTWTAEVANWSLTNGNNTATQSSNSPPSVFHSGQDDLFSRYSGTIRVNTGRDDDFIGFVIGYTSGDIDAPSDGVPANTDIDYLLIDWKQADQVNASRGMSISRVTGDIYTIGNSGTVTVQADAWKHEGVVDEIKRANTLGNLGWTDFQSYGFTLDYLPNLIRLQIDGTVEITLTPSEIGLAEFQPGSVGFYAFSQENTEFSAIEYEDLSPIPLPAGLPLAAAGLGMMAVLKRRRKPS